MEDYSNRELYKMMGMEKQALGVLWRCRIDILRMDEDTFLKNFCNC